MIAGVPFSDALKAVETCYKIITKHGWKLKEVSIIRDEENGSESLVLHFSIFAKEEEYDELIKLWGKLSEKVTAILKEHSERVFVEVEPYTE